MATGSSEETAHERVYRAVRISLVSGQYAPGEPLSIRSLCKEHGVSATPVREVLRRLESDYVLVRGANRALTVPRLSVRDLRDTQRLRSAVEGLAAAMAAERASDADIAEIRALYRDMDEALGAGQVDCYLGLNWAFHKRVYQTADSDLTLHIIENLWLRSGPYLRPLVANAVRDGSDTRRARSMRHHRDCLDALSRRDAEAAQAAIAADISEAAEELFSALRAAHEAMLDDVIPLEIIA